MLLTPDGGRHALGAGDKAPAWVEDIAQVRDQTVAVVAVDAAALERELGVLGLAAGEIEIAVAPENARGPVLRHAGPFTRVLERTVLNYRAPDDGPRLWRPPTSSSEVRQRGTVTYCYSVADCATAGADILLMVADELYYSPVIQAYANHHATYLGLNVAVVGTSSIGELTADELHDFIADVYDTQSAAHFGDGHLGFVILVGDAFGDDNTTVMIPTYDGYGSTEVASDHYYACVSGDDDFEDVMVGRLSVGNVDELVSVVGKSVNYMPMPEGESWRESVLMVAGLFYTVKDDYVQLFDEYEELIPQDWNVDRIYRHDYTNNNDCSIDVVDAFNDGHLIVNYAGDGWISSWYQVIDTTDIPLMTNADRLPIVLSMACMTGWYDNTTEVDQTGSYDCFAEQIVNAPGGGAVACLAAPRASDGGMFRTLTKEIYRAAFEENCAFIGETMAIAKLLHLQNGGSVDYARHFNLFGDPSLVYRWDASPSQRPELTVRPHETDVSPEFPGVGGDLTLSITVRNLSAVPVADVAVRVTDVSAAGTWVQDAVVPLVDDWSSETVTVTVPSLTAAWHVVDVAVDPDDEIEENDESDNAFSLTTYAYPHVPGFPTVTGASPRGPCAAMVDGRGPQIVLMESEARVRSVDGAGQTLWVTDPATDPADYGPEITPAIGDLDGDGRSEVVATRRMGLAAFDSDGQVVWEIITDDPVGSPVLVDADSDGDLDVLLAVKMFFGGSSKVIAVDETGATIWTYSLPSGDPASTTPVVGDFDQDGRPDFAFGTQSGRLGAASCAQNPPVELWAPVQLGDGPVRELGLADLDADGVLEIVAVGVNASSRNAEDGTDEWTVILDSGAVGLAIGDIDSDGVAEILVGTSAGRLTEIDGGVEGWSVQLTGEPCAAPAIADLFGDGEAEIVVRTDDGSLHMLDVNGNPVTPPVPLPGDGCCSPFVADVTDDGSEELCVAASEGRLFVIDFGGTSDDPVVEWRGPGGSATRTGILAQPFAGSFSQSATLAGRYLFTGNVTVETGATVTALPGAVLEFDGAAEPKIEVFGGFAAAGTAGLEVVMRPAGNGAPGGWAGIELKAGATADLTSCSITGAGAALKGYQATVYLDDCSFDDNTYGVYLTACDIEVARSVFSQSDSIGMYLSGGGGTIADCLFDANFRSGLWLHNSASHTITGSTFTGTTAGSGLVCYRFSDAVIDSCYSTANAEHGMLIHNSSPEISRCTISDNSQNGIMTRKLSEPAVSWTTIEDNRIGVVSETGALPNLGDLENANTGNNSIMGNQRAAVANYSDGEFPIQCRGNWWGSYPPNGRIFIGYLKYYPCLPGPPTSGDTKLIVDLEGEDPRPDAFRLVGASPNPFNPVTSIEYEVPFEGPLDIGVFDVAGRRVATLYSGYHDPGTHTVTWNGRDDRGRGVASGVYFVRLAADGVEASRKVVLLQ